MDEELETERLNRLTCGLNRLTCEECGVESDLRAVGWEAHLAAEDDGSESVLCFCPECISEFGHG